LLILLPPSETKRSGGVGISIDKLAIIWAALDPARDVLIEKLELLCADEKKATKNLKLGKAAAEDIRANLTLRTAPTMPAVARYTGVLFQALGYESLSDTAKLRASEQLFIQSALFGLLPATEQIPYYKFSATTKLDGMNLREHWLQAHKAVWPRLVGEVLDLRSKSYVDLNPVPETHSSFTVEVLDDRGKALNHFNKKAKGAFVRAALEKGLASAADIPGIAKTAGLQAEIDGRCVRLLVPEGF
jgi:cytoplasmic iron level regulating protein YaaA (DUF328/UPF0246 family)